MLLPLLPIASISGVLLGLLMAFLSVFLILLILIQRGKGGGLTGALGGPGGQSAFGSKAGDTFTVITVVVASIWGFTCAFTMWLLGVHTPSIADEPFGSSLSSGPTSEEIDDITSGLVVPSDIEDLSEPGGDNDVELIPADAGGDDSDSTDGDAGEADADPDVEMPETDDTETPKTDEPATEADQATNTDDESDAK
ncbi:MAG: preprotein translocase subunit SecG [Planctomycetota bacterium]